jgi:E3 ubiquitin-protein ligase SHPRH
MLTLLHLATEVEANKAVEILGSNATRKSLSHAETLVEVPLLQLKGGIRSADLVRCCLKKSISFDFSKFRQIEELDTLIEDVLNEQANLLWEWRKHIIVLLSRPLTQKEDEVDGQEYQRTLDDQGEVETYLQVYAALLADRRVSLINERTLLAALDVKEKHLRKTKAAFKAAHATSEDELEIPEGLNIQPEHEVLHKELTDKRNDILVKLGGRAIKSVSNNNSRISSGLIKTRVCSRYWLILTWRQRRLHKIPIPRKSS